MSRGPRERAAQGEAPTGASSRELYVLGMLSRGKTHGHAVMKAIRLSRADQWVALSDKHVYYVLRNLARAGLVLESEERHGARPPRKVYALTRAGRDRLASLLRAEALQRAFAPSPFDAVVGILAYSDALDRDAALATLEARRRALAERLAEHPEAAAAALERRFGFLARSLYDKARVLLEAELAWLERVIARVRKGPLDSLRVPRDFLEDGDDRRR